MHLTRSRVLVVDDYPGARYRRMRILMDDGGYDVAEESLGRDALRRAASERFDLVVCDLHLPDISGLDVCRGIKQAPATARLPVLMVSAVTETDKAEKLAKDAGANAFVQDSEDAAAFLAAVRQALG